MFFKMLHTSTTLIAFSIIERYAGNGLSCSSLARIGGLARKDFKFWKATHTHCPTRIPIVFSRP